MIVATLAPEKLAQGSIAGAEGMPQAASLMKWGALGQS
jgi:hypothetical protein